MNSYQLGYEYCPEILQFLQVFLYATKLLKAQAQKQSKHYA